jgi:hypothetical protein
MRPSLAEALVQGGDARLTLLPPLGANRYGCTPLPQDAICSLSSCTASSISWQALAAVEREYALVAQAESSALARRADLQRAELLQLLGLAGTGTRLVFAPSGTDAIALAVFVARAGSTHAGTLHACDSVLIAPDESGRGVPLAAAGCMGDGWPAERDLPPAGAPIPGLGDDLRLASIPVRTQDGAAREPDAIDAQVRAAVLAATAAGRHVLVHAMDSSKCGRRFPSPGVLDECQSRHGPALTVVVDACQGRISAERLASHLARGRLVTITGSKFHGGPPFSGALLVPPAFEAAMSGLGAVPAVLARLTAATAWPAEWPRLRAASDRSPIVGLHLRWTAALAEMRAYAAIPLAQRQSTLATVTTLLHGALDCHPSLAPLASLASLAPLAPVITRGAPAISGGADDLGDDLPTIVPFVLRHDGRCLPYEACSQISQQLHALGMHLGQPVRVGTAGALRICADARLVCALAQAPDGDAWCAAFSQTLDQVLATCERLAGDAGQSL